MEKRSAVVLILVPDGKFSPPDIGSILQRQKGSSHELFIVALSDSIKIPSPMERMAKKLIRVDEQTSIGKILNEIVLLTQSSVLVFSSSRVMPTHDHWLKRICAPLASEKVDAAFGREIPAPGGNYFIAEDIRRKFPLSAGSAPAKLFSMDNCAIRRDALIRNPFSEKPFHDAPAAWLFESGAIPVYCPEALVMRQANRSIAEIFAENSRYGADHALLGDAEFQESARMVCTNIRRDLRFCLSLKKPQHMWYPLIQRSAVFLGYRAGRRRISSSSR